MLKDSFPDLNDSETAELSRIMESGEINSLFMNPDGTYKPEAAKMLMLAQHGEPLIKQFMTIAEKNGETKANEELLSRGSDKPKPHKGGGSKKANGNVLKTIGNLTSGLNKKKTY
jgi:hypothetical protein